MHTGVMVLYDVGAEMSREQEIAKIMMMADMGWITPKQAAGIIRNLPS